MFFYVLYYFVRSLNIFLYIFLYIQYIFNIYSIYLIDFSLHLKILIKNKLCNYKINYKILSII